MKNAIKTILASILLMTGCATDAELEVATTSQSNKFYASIEAPATRTYADEDGKLLWNANDEITVFQGNAYPRQFQFKGETGNNYGEFEELNPPQGIITASPLEANYAIYPYDANTTISNNGQISYTIPAVQNYAENSFGLGANTMVAVTKNTTDNFLAFKNLCGYFEFSLYGDIAVKSIEFSGNNGEKLAGAATITATNQDAPTFIFADGATETITLDCGEGVELGADAANATKFWFVIPATTYTKGITITITDTDGKKMEKSTSKAITIERSTVQPLNAFLVETKTPETYLIHYSATQIVTPNATDVFGANMVSNEWNEATGEGVITFDSDVTSVGIYAFSSCKSLTSIKIPNSVTDVNTLAFSGCSNLTAFYGKFASQDNRCLIVDGELTHFAPAGITQYSIPEGITSIGVRAFEDVETLTEVIIPQGVISIKFGAFNGCEYLQSITIPDSVNTIENSAFYGCTLASNITIGSGLTEIGDNVFGDCKHLTNVVIPDNIISIGKSAFSGCSALERITIGSNVKSIGENTFAYCENLAYIYCKPTTPPSIRNNTFYISPSSILVPYESVTLYKEATWWKNYDGKIMGTTY